VVDIYLLEIILDALKLAHPMPPPPSILLLFLVDTDNKTTNRSSLGPATSMPSLPRACAATQHTMPYNYVIQDVFNYVLWPMECQMNDEDEVHTYYKRFRGLAEPLLDSRWLDAEECDELFWYGFHPDDQTMLLL
jgi:hypothetical protein